MKIFISWSGDYSKEVAEKLSIWIRSVIQSVDTFYSPIDIGKGENWSNRLSQELAECTFGIVCLTPENVSAPWIHFEAGALAKSMDSRLSSIMFGVTPSDIKGPLSRFQNTKFERTDFFKLVQTINNTTDRPLAPNTLAKLFNVMWNELEKEIQPIIQKYGTTPKREDIQTNDHDAIQEILRIVRKNPSPTGEPLVHNKALTLKDTREDSKMVSLTIKDFGTQPERILSALSTTTHFSVKELLDTINERHKLTVVLPVSLATTILPILEISNALYTYDFI